jgi:hypothetical protein
MKKVLPIALALVLVYSLWQLPVWDQGVEDVPPSTQPQVTARASHPPGTPHPGTTPGMAPGSTAGGSPSGGVAPPSGSLELKPTGLGGQNELDAALAKLHDHDRAKFEEAFRLTFATDKQVRNYPRAKQLFQELLGHDPDHAPSYRGLAYAEFNITMSFPETIRLYRKAVELDGAYGEAHYALSFMLGNSDAASGRVHFDRAMALGIEDERNLGERFYQ